MPPITRVAYDMVAISECRPIDSTGDVTTPRISKCIVSRRVAHVAKERSRSASAYWAVISRVHRSPPNAGSEAAMHTAQRELDQRRHDARISAEGGKLSKVANVKAGVGSTKVGMQTRTEMNYCFGAVSREPTFSSRCPFGSLPGRCHQVPQQLWNFNEGGYQASIFTTTRQRNSTQQNTWPPSSGRCRMLDAHHLIRNPVISPVNGAKPAWRLQIRRRRVRKSTGRERVQWWAPITIAEWKHEGDPRYRRSGTTWTGE